MAQYTSIKREEQKKDKRTADISEYIKRITQTKAPQERDRNIPYTEAQK